MRPAREISTVTFIIKNKSQFSFWLSASRFTFFALITPPNPYTLLDEKCSTRNNIKSLTHIVHSLEKSKRWKTKKEDDINRNCFKSRLIIIILLNDCLFSILYASLYPLIMHVGQTIQTLLSESIVHFRLNAHLTFKFQMIIIIEMQHN